MTGALPRVVVAATSVGVVVIVAGVSFWVFVPILVVGVPIFLFGMGRMLWKGHRSGWEWLPP